MVIALCYNYLWWVKTVYWGLGYYIYCTLWLRHPRLPCGQAYFGYHAMYAYIHCHWCNLRAITIGVDSWHLAGTAVAMWCVHHSLSLAYMLCYWRRPRGCCAGCGPGDVSILAPLLGIIYIYDIAEWVRRSQSRSKRCPSTSSSVLRHNNHTSDSGLCINQGHASNVKVPQHHAQCT
jgi:hypothetical protein